MLVKNKKHKANKNKNQIFHILRRIFPKTFFSCFL